MEFPYPQSMANCVTCHEGKLDMILTDANFKVATCKSCHPVTGGTDTGKLVVSSSGATSTVYADNTVGLALSTILPAAIHGSMDLNTVQCNLCHAAGTGISVFRDIHSGYEKTTYTATGVKYSSAFTVTIDNASFANNELTFGFHATENPDLPGLAVTNIVPTVMVGLYGWDTKDYIVGPHEKSIDDDLDGTVGDTQDSRNLEAAVGSVHPRITTVSAAGGSWTVKADLSAWADTIADGTVKRVEIAVMPRLQADVIKWKNGTAKETLAINAPSRTFDLGTNAFVNNYYQGTGAIVNVAAGCNNCHEALGTTFHTADRGGNIVVCRLCHITKSGGSHLEMQSRSIDSYAHAIHSFQAFDIADIDFTDPVEAMKYDHHIEHTYPNFTIKNCKSCHVEGKFNVPDQSKSLSGLLSAADPSPDGWNRNIGAVPYYFTGPASRACGGCHRAAAIKEDDPVALAAFNSHTRTNGCLIEYATQPTTAVVEEVIMEYMEYLFVLSAP
jgi:OmcA/MtrC family decaheme c-type cytochrome